MHSNFLLNKILIYIDILLHKYVKNSLFERTMISIT